LFLEEVATRHADELDFRVRDGAGWRQAAGLCVPHNMRVASLAGFDRRISIQLAATS
jgi:hypothetical protein